MERGRQGRGARRLVVVLAAAVAGVAVLALVFLRGTEDRAAVFAPAAPAAGKEQPEAAAGLVPAAAQAEPAAVAPRTAEVERANGEPAPPEARGQRVAVPLGLHGRVLDAETGAPLAGVALERTFVGSVDRRALSGPDGAFAFPAGVSKHGTLQAVLEGWRFEPSRIVLRKHEVDEIVFRGARILTAPLRGRLVDARTGQPVPRYRIGFDTRDEDTVLAVTDEHGRFATEGELELGQVEVWLSEAVEQLTLEHGVEGASAEHELSVAVGPTFFFDLQAPAEIAVEDLSVRLLEPASVPSWPFLPERGSSEFLDLDLDPPSHATVHGVPRGSGERLRTDGDPAWVRLPPLDPDDWPMPGPEGYALLVYDDEEGWAGAGHAASLAGVQEGRIPVRLEAFCALRGSLAAPGEERVENAVVTLSGGASPAIACVTDEDGEFGFAVPAGRYELRVESRRGMLGPRPVELAAGEVRLDLELLPGATIEVAGTLRTRTGLFDEFVPLELRSLADPRLRFRAEAYSSSMEEGEIAATFRFDPVPAGAYELLAEPYMGVAFEPSRILLDRSVTDLEILCRDDFERTTLAIRLEDPEGNPVEDALVLVWVEGERRPVPPESSSSDAAQVTLPAGVPVRWAALAEGCLPAEGTWPGSKAAEEVLTVRLERGRAFSVLVVDPWFNGIDQAELLLDEAPVGRTNELGYGIFPAREVPSSVRIRKQGFAAVFSYSDLDDGMAFFILAPEANPP